MTTELDYEALYQQERQQREQAEILVQIAAVLNAQPDLAAAMSAVCNETARMFNLPIVTISLYDPQTQELYLAYEVGLPLAIRHNIRRLPQHIYDEYTQANGRIVITPDIQNLPDLPNSTVYQEINLRTTVNVSMIFENNLIGRLNIATLGQARTFTDREIALLQGIANQAAIAIHRAHLHEQVQQYAADLELRVNQRTAALEASNRELENTLAELQQHANNLQQKNEELDAFAHTVAHDLRSPLSVLLGYAELMLQDHQRFTEQERGIYLQKVITQGQRIHNIIEELLLLSTLRKTEIVTVPITNMHAIVLEAVERVSHMLNRTHGHIEILDEWPIALGYAPWLEEVWVNYLSNAIKYGGTPPQIRLQTAVQPDGMIRFCVIDNGPGLTTAQQQKLFTPFTRLHQIRASGYGLGLSIVHRIITKLDGRVGVISIPGQGSTFYFDLPPGNPTP